MLRAETHVEELAQIVEDDVVPHFSRFYGACAWVQQVQHLCHVREIKGSCRVRGLDIKCAGVLWVRTAGASEKGF